MWRACRLNYVYAYVVFVFYKSPCKNATQIRRFLYKPAGSMKLIEYTTYFSCDVGYASKFGVDSIFVFKKCLWPAKLLSPSKVVARKCIFLDSSEIKIFGQSRKTVKACEVVTNEQPRQNRVMHENRYPIGVEYMLVSKP